MLHERYMILNQRLTGYMVAYLHGIGRLSTRYLVAYLHGIMVLEELEFSTAWRRDIIPI